MKEGTCTGIIIASLLLILSVTLYAGPTVTVLTDKGSYRAGETIEVSLGGENHDEPLNVDVYVGLIGRDGALYTLGEAGWGAYLEPWMADLLVPNPFYMVPVAFQWFDIPCAMPPIGEAGEYSFAAGLTQPGTLDFVAEISFAPFTINPPELHVYVSAETGNDANDGSLDSPFKTITHALASIEGSEAHPVTIHVADGTYAASTNGETFPLNMKSWVSLIGKGPASTILDAEGLPSHVVGFEYVEGAAVEGFTMTGVEAASGPWPKYYGGGIYCLESSPTITNNTIVGNTARFGGGIYLSSSSPTITGNEIVHNHSVENGAGIYCFDSLPLIANNLICDNTALNRGGGIYCLSNSSPKVRNNTIAYNSAERGDGVYASPSSYPSIKDCILWGNGDDLYGCGASYSCIEDGGSGEGNIHDEPMFVTGPLGEFYLHPESPCVDAGSRSAEEAGLADRTTQAEGTPDTGIVDMGYHHPIPDE